MSIASGKVFLGFIKCKSDDFITVWRNVKIYEQDYIRGVPQHSVTSKPNDSKIPHGTQILLKPDTPIFESTQFSKEKLQTWVSENYCDLKGNVVLEYKKDYA